MKTGRGYDRPMANEGSRSMRRLAVAVLVMLTVFPLPLVAQGSDPGPTIAKWIAANATCRDAAAPAIEAVGACEQRDRYSKLLALMSHCYGPLPGGGQPAWRPCDPASMAQAMLLARTTARFQRRNGVLVLPASVNLNTEAFFIVDSGAAKVQIPQEVADELMRKGTLSQGDFLREHTFIVADGRRVAQKVIRLRSIGIGDRSVENVLATIGAPHSQALLGQSLLQRLNWWKIDNVRNALELEFAGSF